MLLIQTAPSLGSESEVTQSCPTLCDLIDCSLPGSLTMELSRQGYWSGSVDLNKNVNPLGLERDRKREREHERKAVG